MRFMAPQKTFFLFTFILGKLVSNIFFYQKTIFPKFLSDQFSHAAVGIRLAQVGVLLAVEQVDD